MAEDFVSCAVVSLLHMPFIVILMCVSSVAQEVTSVPALPGVRLMQRVDTANPEIRRVVRAWTDSLAVWRHSSLGIGSSVSRSGLAGMPDGVVRNWFAQSAEVVATFPPTILSVEPDGNKWTVRTMFSASDILRGAIMPLGILNTVFELDANGNALLENPLHRKTKSWQTYSTDRIEYIYPTGIRLDKSRANAASDFVERTAQTFRLEPPSTIVFYLTKSRDAMCELLGIEYYSYPPSGLSYPAENIVLSGIGDAWYPHELVHIVFRDYDDAHPVIREGVATWLGGSLGEEFDVLLARYLRAKQPGEVPSFVRLFTDPYLSQDDSYILGAALCKAVYNKAGSDAVLELLRERSASDVMIRLSRILGLEPSDKQENLVPLLTQLSQETGVDAGR